MKTITIENYKTLNICDLNIEFKMRIQQYITYNNFIAVFIKPEKNDPEYAPNLIGGEIIFVNNQGIYWEFPGRAITKIWKIDDNTLGIHEKQVDLWLNVNQKDIVKMIWNPLELTNPQGSMSVTKENSQSLKVLNLTIDFPGEISQWVLYETFVAVLLSDIEDSFKSNLGGGNIFFANEKGIFWQLPAIKPIYMSHIWKKDEKTLGIYDGQYDLWLDVNSKEYIKEIWNPWGMPNPERYYTKSWQNKMEKINSKKTKNYKKHNKD